MFDVAQYILQAKGPVTAMKLQKLVYYCQAWSLVWDDAPLFDEQIQAWANGPVCPELYNLHRGMFLIHGPLSVGAAGALSDVQRETIDAVLLAYSSRTSHWLSDLTHSEAPWNDAREGMPGGARGSQEITHAAMAEFYGSLSSDKDAKYLIE